MTPNDREQWRVRAVAMAERLRADLPDEDWQGAMKVIVGIGVLAKLPAAAIVAKRAIAASGCAPQGLAVRRATKQQLLAALTPKREAA